MLNRVRMNWDAFGVCASTLCMVHCLAFPLLLALVLPQRGLEGNARGAKIPISNSVDNPASRKTGRCDTRDVTAAEAAANGAGARSLPCCENEGCCAVAAKNPDADGGLAAAAGCCSTPSDKGIHAWLLGAVASAGLIALISGYQRHRHWAVIALGLTGIVLLAAALFVGPDVLSGRGEQTISVLGSIGMISAHFWNRRQCRCCNSSGR